MLDAEDGALDLVGQAVGLPVGRPAAVVERIQTAFLVAVEDLVAGAPRNAELPARGAIFLFQEEGYNLRRSSIGLYSFQGIWNSPKCGNV